MGTRIFVSGYPIGQPEFYASVNVSSTIVRLGLRIRELIYYTTKIGIRFYIKRLFCPLLLRCGKRESGCIQEI